MLTAEEARKIAQDENNIIAKQFKTIEKWINEAVMDGMCDITFNDNLHPYIKRFLENLGYRVVLVSDSDTIYIVSW